jgi:hypothetical protein
MRKIVKWVLIVLAVILLGLFSIAYWGVYERGSMAGKVIRVSEKGFLFKTFEGKLSLDTFGALKGVSPIAETFDFSVNRKDKEIITQLEQVALTGERVSLSYIKRFKVFFWRGDTKYFVVAVTKQE